METKKYVVLRAYFGGACPGLIVTLDGGDWHGPWYWGHLDIVGHTDEVPQYRRHVNRVGIRTHDKVRLKRYE